MEQLRIDGGASLSGSVRADGAKNAALPACIASLLTDDPVVLHDVPQLRDVSTILYTLGTLGKRVVRHGDHVSIGAGERLVEEADAFSVRQMRASFLVLAPLLARLGRAVVPLPGGCAIGRRPVDLHLDGLRSLGARVTEEGGVVVVSCDRLIGARIDLPFPSVGATEQILMAAVLARGETRILNGAIEPEVEDVVCLLKKMGAQIETDGRTYTVTGMDRLGGAEHTLIPDRMEAGTLLLAGAMTRGAVSVLGANGTHLEPFLRPLRETGAEVTVNVEGVHVQGPARPRPVDVNTAPHPGFPTDLHPPLVAHLALAEGTSRMVESVFDGRFAYAEALSSMGAQLARSGSALVIHGVPGLRGGTVAAPDIRAGAALVLAGLVAQGETVVSHLDHIDRGYSGLEGKLRALGARIEREGE